MDFFLSEAGSRRGRSPVRHTHPERCPRLPRPALPGPAASRELPARPRGRRRKLTSGSCPPSLASSRPHSSSHPPAPHEEQDASSPRGATTGSDPSIVQRSRRLRLEGRGRDRGGQGAGNDITGGGGPGEKAARPRLPINPRDVVISGLGVVAERSLKQVAAVSGTGVSRLGRYLSGAKTVKLWVTSGSAAKHRALQWPTK